MVQRAVIVLQRQLPAWQVSSIVHVVPFTQAVPSSLQVWGVVPLHRFASGVQMPHFPVDETHTTGQVWEVVAVPLALQRYEVLPEQR